MQQHAAPINIVIPRFTKLNESELTINDIPPTSYTPMRI